MKEETKLVLVEISWRAQREGKGERNSTSTPGTDVVMVIRSLCVFV